MSSNQIAVVIDDQCFWNELISVLHFLKRESLQGNKERKCLILLLLEGHCEVCLAKFNLDLPEVLSDDLRGIARLDIAENERLFSLYRSRVFFQFNI